MMPGSTHMSSAVPAVLPARARIKPGFERSMIHQRIGLTRATVSATCRVDVQASLR